MNRKDIVIILTALALVSGAAGIASAAVQDKYALPEPYLAWEKAYLKEFPELQGLMDTMIATAVRQLKAPEGDILHNRVCSALAYEMGKPLAVQERRLAVAADILHNISKEDKGAVLTDPDWFRKCSEMVARLKKAGYFKPSPGFWGDEALLKSPKVGANLALVHHITGALTAGGAAAILANCSAPEAMASALDLLSGFGLPFGAYANGFTRITKAFLRDSPTVDALSARPEMTPALYADFALRWVGMGATIIGGCCETTPAHIAEISRRLRAEGHSVV